MKYYVKIRGSVRGPFEPSQIATLIQQGKIGKYNELSVDGKSWERASEFSEFFRRGATASNALSKSNSDADLAIVESDREPRPFEADSTFEPNSRASGLSNATKTDAQTAFKSKGQTDEPAVWFVSNDGVTGAGPYSTREIWRFLETGKATPNSLVWIEGLPARALKEVPEFGKAPGADAEGSAPDPSRGVALQGELRCGECGAPIPGDAAFCPKCGAAKPASATGPTRTCPSCRASVPATAKNCPKCGRSLTRQIRKSRLIYAALGIFVGCVGAHNFYARRFGAAKRQLLLFVFGVGFLVFRAFAPNVLASIPNADRVDPGRLDLLFQIAGWALLGVLELWVVQNVFCVAEDEGGLPFEPLFSSSDVDAPNEENGDARFP